MPTKRGIFGSAAAFAKGAHAGNIESSSGKASVTPAPRNTVRREICFWVMNMRSPSFLLPACRRHRAFGFAIHLERVALDDPQNQRSELVIVALGFALDAPHHGHFVVIDAPA